MNPLGTKTKLNFSDDRTDPILFGNERWPVLGDLYTADELAPVIECCGGLSRYWRCIEKAVIAQRYLNAGVIIVGSLFVVSNDELSSYGFGYNPPFEFHAWVQFGDKILDVALPGIIEKGLTLCDTDGPVLVGRSAVILAGTPLPWMHYFAVRALRLKEKAEVMARL